MKLWVAVTAVLIALSVAQDIIVDPCQEADRNWWVLDASQLDRCPLCVSVKDQCEVRCRLTTDLSALWNFKLEQDGGEPFVESPSGDGVTTAVAIAGSGLSSSDDSELSWGENGVSWNTDLQTWTPALQEFTAGLALDKPGNAPGIEIAPETAGRMSEISLELWFAVDLNNAVASGFSNVTLLSMVHNETTVLNVFVDIDDADPSNAPVYVSWVSSDGSHAVDTSAGTGKVLHNEITHLLITFEDATTSIYIDGMEAGSTTAPVSPPTSRWNGTLPVDYTLGSSQMKGQIFMSAFWSGIISETLIETAAYAAGPAVFAIDAETGFCPLEGGVFNALYIGAAVGILTFIAFSVFLVRRRVNANRDGFSAIAGNKEEATRQETVDALFDAELILVSALIDVSSITQAERLCKALIEVFAANGHTLFLLKSVFGREVAYSESERELFRTDSRASKMMTYYGSHVGGEWMTEALSNQHSAEVTRVLSGSPPLDMADAKSRSKLISAANSLLESINTSTPPPELRIVLEFIMKAVKVKWGEDAADRAVAGFIYSRLLIPKLTSAHKAPNMITLAKMIQGLALGNEFGGVKNPAWAPLNAWAEQQRPELLSFLRLAAATSGAEVAALKAAAESAQSSASTKKAKKGLVSYEDYQDELQKGGEGFGTLPIFVTRGEGVAEALDTVEKFMTENAQAIVKALGARDKGPKRGQVQSEVSTLLANRSAPATPPPPSSV